MTIWTEAEAIEFAKACASEALDIPGQFGTWENTRETIRENIRDTLQEFHAVDHEWIAFATFDKLVGRV